VSAGDEVCSLKGVCDYAYYDGQTLTRLVTRIGYSGVFPDEVSTPWNDFIDTTTVQVSVRQFAAAMALNSWRNVPPLDIDNDVIKMAAGQLARKSCLVLILCFGTLGSAQEDAGGYLTSYLDNDLFGGADRDYTNGVRLSWISEGEPLFNLMPVRKQLEKLAGADGDYRLVRAVSGFDKDHIEDQSLELNYGLSLTQLMFTPNDFSSPTQPPGERRYAGWLGLGFSVHALDDRAVNSVELIFGTTGPRSHAKETQNFVHDLRNIDRFRGWRDQIPNEFTVDLSFAQKRRIRFLDRRAEGFSVDGFTEWTARLGTFRTLAQVGGFFRAGFNLPADFSDPRITATAYSHKFFGDAVESSRPWSAYALFGLGLTGIAYDATLDGPLFSNFDTGNEREPWVTDLFAGFGLRWKSIEFSYVHTWRSDTYVNQRYNPNFGSVALRLRL